MKLDPEKLPICQEVLTGHVYYNKEGDRIEKGDVIQIIAPKSKYHKWVCLFSIYSVNSIDVLYNTGMKDLSLTKPFIKGTWIDPREEFLTWEDFKIVKLDSLEEAEK